MPKTLQRSTITRSLAAAATAVAIAAVGAIPASAWAVDHPLIAGGDIQFGRGWNGAAPTAGGNLHWDVTPVSGIVTPRLSGNIFALNSDGYDVRVRMTYYNAAHEQIDLRHSGWQPASGNFVDIATGLNVFPIVGLNTFGAINVYGVGVEVQRRLGPAGAVERLGYVEETI